MAAGDVVFFEESRALMLTGDWGSTDVIKVAICDNTSAPTASQATPALGDFTEVGTAGTYSAGGASIGTYTSIVSEAGGTVTFDSATNPTWALNASNDTDAYWGIGHNSTAAGSPALFYVDLGGPVNMATGALTITWNASGIATITAA